MFFNEDEITKVPLDAEDIIERNWRFYDGEGHKYEIVNDPNRVEWEIRQNEKTRRKIECILDNFPFQETVENQCGYWVRSISGVHPFPNANHRTSTETLLYILNENGYKIAKVTKPLIGDSVNRSKKLKKPPNAIQVTTDNLRERDKLFRLWRDHFEYELWRYYVRKSL